MRAWFIKAFASIVMMGLASGAGAEDRYAGARISVLVVGRDCSKPPAELAPCFQFLWGSLDTITSLDGAKICLPMETFRSQPNRLGYSGSLMQELRDVIIARARRESNASAAFVIAEHVYGRYECKP